MLLIYVKHDLRKSMEYISLGIGKGLKLHPTVSELISTYIGFDEDTIDQTYYLLEALRKEGVNVPIECMNIVISNCSLIGDFDRAYGTFLEAVNLGLRPNQSTIAALLTYDGDYDKKYISAILEDIEKYNIKINTTITRKIESLSQ